MNKLDLPHVFRIIAHPTLLRVMGAIKGLGRASVEDIMLYLGDITARQVSHNLYKLVEIGFVRRIPVRNIHAEWQYDEEVCRAFVEHIKEIF